MDHDMTMDPTMSMDMGGTTMDMGGGGGMDYMMKMWFHGGTNEMVLFDFWRITDDASMAYSFFIIFIAAFLYEGLKYMRNELYAREAKSAAAKERLTNSNTPLDWAQSKQSWSTAMFSAAHLLQTVLHAVQFFLSYLLMLVFMTYNSWLCLAVVLGAALGYFIFGWQKQNAVDITEHCH